MKMKMMKKKIMLLVVAVACLCVHPILTSRAAEVETQIEATETDELEDLENVNDSDAVVESERPSNHLQGRFWLTDSSGMLTTILSANEAYTFHLNMNVAGEMDAENVVVYIPNQLYDGVIVPMNDQRYYHECRVIYIANASNVGADTGELCLTSSRSDTPLNMKYVSGSAALQIEGIPEAIKVSDVDLFTVPGVILGVNGRDGNLPTGNITCELSFAVDVTTDDTWNVNTSTTLDGTTNEDVRRDEPTDDSVGITQEKAVNTNVAKMQDKTDSQMIVVGLSNKDKVWLTIVLSLTAAISIIVGIFVVEKRRKK